MNSDTPTVWIDILSDPGVRLAARAWRKDLSETWGILSRAIQREDISQFMPLTHFDSYIALLAPTAPPILSSPPNIPPGYLGEMPKAEGVKPAPYPLATLFLTFSNLTSIIGGILALLYSLYVVVFLFGWVNAVIALIFFPLTYTLLPFYTLFTYGDFTLLAANYGVGILALILSYIGHRLEETRPRIKLTLSSVLGFIVFCCLALFAYGWFKDIYLMPVLYASQPPPTSTRPPAPTSKPRPTPTDSCLLWSRVTTSMEGQTLCVYGTVSSHKEDWQNEITSIYFGSTDQFFLVSNYRWDTPLEGTCLTATGKIQLNTYRVPYIKIQDQVNFCN